MLLRIGSSWEGVLLVYIVCLGCIYGQGECNLYTVVCRIAWGKSLTLDYTIAIVCVLNGLMRTRRCI